MIRPYLKPFFYAFKLFVKSPKKLIKELLQDIKKDFFIKNNNLKNRFVWCSGLPKSGTTLIENIFDELPYVRVNASPIRFYDSDYKNKQNEHDITLNMIKFINYKKMSFLKTHTQYTIGLKNIIKKDKTKILVTIRDLRSMLISRYFHIKNDPNHWQFAEINKIDLYSGLILSFKSKIRNDNKKSYVIDYYKEWILSWINQKTFNVLILKYEEYNINFDSYLRKISDYCEINFNIDKIEEKLKNKRMNNDGIKKTLQIYGKDRSTYNPSRINYYEIYKKYDLKNFFKDNIDEKYWNLICYDNNFQS